MPHITMEFIKGRSDEQKAEFARQVTDTCVEVLRTKRENVVIRFVEIEDPVEVATAGEFVPNE